MSPTSRRRPRYAVGCALAAIAAARAVNSSVGQSVAALADFAGLARRYEVLGQANGVTVIDDFAHNPDKVAATLAAVYLLLDIDAGRTPAKARVF